MLSRIQVTVLLAVVVALWAALLAIEGYALSFKLLAPFSGVVSGLVVVLLVFDKWLWKVPWLGVLLGAPANIDGTWKGTLASEWVSPKTLQKAGPIEIYLVIRQTFTTLSVRTFTAESESMMVAGKVESGADGVSDLVTVYRNVPKQSLRDRSQIHHGALRLRIEGAPPTQLAGEYWTERESKGELRLAELRKGAAHSFEQAQVLFRNP